MQSTAALLCALLLSSPDGDGDPRLALVEEQLKGRPQKALHRSGELATQDPELARELWLGYLRGDLFEQLGRLEHANTAFARLLSAEPELAAYSRLRMAALQEAMGHPEVAAGLLASLLGRGAPDALVPRAVELLARTLEAGADCRLLGRLDAWNITETDRRPLRLAQAGCALDGGDIEGGGAILIQLLERENTDLVALRAAQILAGRDPAAAQKAEVQIAIGLAFHHNREFERAIAHLERGLAGLDPERLTVSADAIDEYRYATARAYFWQRDYARAASLFRELAATVSKGETAARALYQAARCHELAGEWAHAGATYREAFAAQPTGDWSGAALFSAMRIDFRLGRESAALELFSALDSRPAWRDLARRAALFLSASDLERGRADRAAGWLRRTPGKHDAEEFLYWSGRLAELRQQPERAIGAYLEIIARGEHHPLAGAARTRLQDEALQPLLEPLAQRLAASGRRQDLLGAWILLGDTSAAGQAARGRLLQSLAADARASQYLAIQRVPPRHWPLWSSELTRFEDRMLALGLWPEGESRMGHFFPFSEPNLAFSAATLLGQAGLTRKSLRVVEILANGAPRVLPEALWPLDLRRHLYPHPYREAIESQSDRRGIEPELLAGLIREESRFDPDAVSVASARGLTQFVQPTAKRIAGIIGLDIDDPRDLHRPGVAIALGAAYLAELLELFDGRVEDAVTAYNAGEDQTRLWRSYCYSRNPAEYYTKVGFAQTRSYLRKVLTSRNQYSELYGAS